MVNWLRQDYGCILNAVVQTVAFVAATILCCIPFVYSTVIAQPAALDAAQTRLTTTHAHHQTVIDQVNETHDFDALPVLDIGNRMGNTGYIDFINSSELTAPLMKEVDCLNRPFFAFKVYNNATNQFEPKASVVFQRYASGDMHLRAPAGLPEHQVHSENDRDIALLSRLTGVVGMSGVSL